MEYGFPIPTGRTDVERLQSGELVYSGVRRTPLCAVAPSLRFRGTPCPLAAELFATMLDAYLLLGDVPEDPNDFDTANGRAATVSAAHDRMARMLCCDRNEVTREEAREMARSFADEQFREISEALARVRARLEGSCDQVVVSGSGEFLAERVVRRHADLANAGIVSLSSSLPREVSAAACAYAVARLGTERLGSLLY
jgi:(4-(4-[2-(gamma-L-glutamylamino)ethyl]phenoxymethyl)furan-2-yl)methanamine synthase